MKKFINTLIILSAIVERALAYDFSIGNLLYSINSTTPPEVRLVGHVDGTFAQGELVIPATVTHEGITYTVTIIGKNAFSGCQLLTGNLIIPNSIEEIKAGAFYNCVGFTGDLIIPNSVTRINIDNSMENTVPGTFENCSGFNGHLVLSNSLEIIGDAQGGGCFRGCVNFKGELMLPNTLTYIGESAFAGCESLTGTLIIPESVAEISHYAFAGCMGIEDVVFPNTPLTKGSFVFGNCNSLTSITLPEGWTSTGEYIFNYCTGLQEVHLPESLTIIDRGAFADCPRLESISFPDGVKMILNNAFSNCTALESIDFPDNLEVISYAAFSGCTGLSNRLVVPANELKWRAFRSCTSIRHLVLGEHINYFSEAAFEDTNIESITIKAIVPPEFDTIGIWHFDRNIPIIIPYNTLETYQNAEDWNEFTNMHEGITDLFSVVSANESQGTVAVLKEASYDDKLVQVEALPNQGYEFLCWEANGVQISSENPYSFELEKDTELIAFFSGNSVIETEQILSIYPNPTTGFLTVTGENLQQAEVFNTLGQLVFSVQGKGNELRIDLAALPVGVYFVTTTDEEGRKFVRKVVRE